MTESFEGFITMILSYSWITNTSKRQIFVDNLSKNIIDCSTSKWISINNFSDALISGYDSAIESLMNPEEGTIITVMRDVANKSKKLFEENPDINFEIFYKENIFACSDFIYSVKRFENITY